jgi:Cu+-exporting ATPase
MAESDLCPVCGTKVDPGSTLTAEYEGETYRFCSTDCLSSFQMEPQSYVPQGEATEDVDPLGPHMGSVRPGA